MSHYVSDIAETALVITVNVTVASISAGVGLNKALATHFSRPSIISSYAAFVILSHRKDMQHVTSSHLFSLREHVHALDDGDDDAM